MSKFPKIDGPCPYLDRLSEIMDGDHCRMCQRSVTDLTDMTDAARTRFLASCSGETCVTYRFPMKPSLAAAAIAAATLVAVPAAAQPARAAPPEAAAAPADQADEEEITELYITGGRIPMRPIYQASPQSPVVSGPKPPEAQVPPRPDTSKAPSSAPKPKKPAKGS